MSDTRCYAGFKGQPCGRSDCQPCVAESKRIESMYPTGFFKTYGEAKTGSYPERVAKLESENAHLKAERDAALARVEKAEKVCEAAASYCAQWLPGAVVAGRHLIAALAAWRSTVPEEKGTK